MMNVAFVILIIIGFLVYRHFTWKAEAWPQGAFKPPTYQGHRGYWKGGEQENTLGSFRAARKRGLQMIELDVQLSKGGVPVVFHDADLKRLGKSDQKVLDLEVEELEKLVGAPSLESVLKDPDVPRWLNIELKSSAIFDNGLEAAVAEVVRKTNSEKRILFSSFNPLAIRRLSHYLPDVPRALLASKEDAVGNRFYLRHLWLAPYVKAHALHLDFNYISEDELRAYSRRGIPVALWTVNDAEKAEGFLKAGAFSIISDTLGEVPALKQN